MNIAVLSGAGMSAESGLKTFRDADGLWEGHDVMEVASIDGWLANPALVLEFYNQRRRQLKTVIPNDGHEALAKLAQFFTVNIITQNVDDLHERAGSSDVVHLHGELLLAQSSIDENCIYPCHDDIKIGDLCEYKSQLRPAIVWFGEAVPKMEDAALKVAQADILIVVGTSLQVYPAAGLVNVASRAKQIYYIDPKPDALHAFDHSDQITVIQDSAAKGLPKLVEQLINQA
ncbi:SIR2 family NAD-dependent protein deacylase [Thalassotalea agarivorans]|uniref:NAD-dependent protein deacylase n=1 Tax=Thalassotalea agarivorans TaxID=349064 RepID=A0A1I0BW48_THASX|nr:NAD-dependent deacylase [Thalassotalea agarivorans]SET11308.1 NAD-dependent deacetylase [Thalassotalea agarivorans]